MDLTIVKDRSGRTELQKKPLLNESVISGKISGIKKIEVSRAK